MKRAFVTGCAGFIGSNLAERLLHDGYEVIMIARFSDSDGTVPENPHY